MKENKRVQEHSEASRAATLRQDGQSLMKRWSFFPLCGNNESNLRGFFFLEEQRRLAARVATAESYGKRCGHP